ncbi:MAG: hypothetical protein HQL99_08905 [Magnetococcales bacterium]|nr:hypothetical protein [Magnetococcales bacterium]
MTITPASLEAEWSGNLQRRKRRTIHDLMGGLLQALSLPPDESHYALLGLKPHQLLKRKSFDRHYPPLLTFVWKQAVLATHPHQAQSFSFALERLIPGLPGMNTRRLELLFNDLTFFQLISDTFAEDGFMSVALHVVQRIHGEVEKQPENLEWAVGLNLWLDERFVNDRETLELAEIVIGQG